MSKEETRYIICQHPEHKAVLEIIEAGELKKFESCEGAYRHIAEAPTRVKALSVVQKLLLLAYEKDPGLERVRELVAAAAEENKTDARG